MSLLNTNTGIVYSEDVNENEFNIVAEVDVYFSNKLVATRNYFFSNFTDPYILINEFNRQSMLNTSGKHTYVVRSVRQFRIWED